MIRVPRLTLATLAGLLAATPLAARAQMPPGAQPGGTIGEDETKPEGAAEKAPEAGQLPTTPVLPPYPGQKKKQFQVFELDGYLRFRTDWFSNFQLGFHNIESGVPFPEPATCQEMSTAMSACSDTIGSANMRLRLEPTINVSEKVAVKFQIDVLDNVVLGSTPDGTVLTPGVPEPPNVPVTAFSGGQVSPEAGRNEIRDAIRVKNAWAEVMTPLGLLRFGRMPSHWGLGLLANAGGRDPFRAEGDSAPFQTEGTCYDCDFGDSADRIIFGTKIPGTRFRAAVGMDWASSQPVASQTGIWLNRYQGQPWDLDDADDVRQWIFVLADLDSPEEWKDKIELGELAFNWGVYLVYRAQDWDTKFDLGTNAVQTTYRPRSAFAYIPDLFLRVGYKKLFFEAEAVAVYGEIDDLTDLSSGAADLGILQIGAVGRLSYLIAEDDLKLGLEVGFASGDQWEPRASGTTNVFDAPFVPEDFANDDTLSAFRFDPAYHVDLILFRELIGTVTNATYVKPSLRYNLTDRLVFRAAGIISFANVPVATPGNATMYGIELDGDLGYFNREEGFFAGISYGVLFPLGALDHPSSIFPPAEAGDADTAQTIQTRLIVSF